MKTEQLRIGDAPALLYGEASDRVYLCVHGQYGCKEEALGFAQLACPMGWQVVSIDLPGHGERKGQDTFYPWIAVPELETVMYFLKERWPVIGLYAGSIGAWFSLLAFARERFHNSLFVAPLLDMQGLIHGMMQKAGVDEARLEREGRILTDGDTLSWRYLTYAKEHAELQWLSPLSMLCPEKDALTPLAVSKAFAGRLGAHMTVLEGAEHWIHEPKDVEKMMAWIRETL